MNNKWIKVIAAFAGLFIVVGLVLNWACILCFDSKFYADEYRKLNTAQEIGMSEEDLGRATETLLDYLTDKRKDLDVTAVIKGQEREVFNEREKAHMVDVKALYQGAVLAGNLLLAAGVVFMVWMLLLKKRRRAALGGYLVGNGVFFVLLAGIGLFAALDFNVFWTGFHQIFFTNDLWLLNPSTDILIMMVPGQFFFDLVMRIAIASLLTIGALFAAATLAVHRLKKREEMAE